MTSAPHRLHLKLVRIAKDRGADFTVNPVELAWVQPPDQSQYMTPYKLSLHNNEGIVMFASVAPRETVIVANRSGGLVVINQPG